MDISKANRTTKFADVDRLVLASGWNHGRWSAPQGQFWLDIARDQNPNPMANLINVTAFPIVMEGQDIAKAGYVVLSSRPISVTGMPEPVYDEYAVPAIQDGTFYTNAIGQHGLSEHDLYGSFPAMKIRKGGFYITFFAPRFEQNSWMLACAMNLLGGPTIYYSGGWKHDDVRQVITLTHTNEKQALAVADSSQCLMLSTAYGDGIPQLTSAPTWQVLSSKWECLGSFTFFEAIGAIAMLVGSLRKKMSDEMRQKAPDVKVDKDEFQQAIATYPFLQNPDNAYEWLKTSYINASAKLPPGAKHRMDNAMITSHATGLKRAVANANFSKVKNAVESLKAYEAKVDSVVVAAKRAQPVVGKQLPQAKPQAIKSTAEMQATLAKLFGPAPESSAEPKRPRKRDRSEEQVADVEGPGPN